MKKQRTQVERSETTRAELVAAARKAFARDGYANTQLDSLAAKAGVTKGALYHHFRSKQELFEAVFEDQHRRLAERGVRTHTAEADPTCVLHEACRAFLEAALDPALQRILLLDGPSVLGWNRVRDIESRHSIAYLRRGLELAMAAGMIATRPAAPLAQMLNGAICEAAMFVARSKDPNTCLIQTLAELRRIVDALVTPSR